MKKYSLPFLSLIVALPAAAQVVAIGDVSGFKEALKSVEAPATPAARSLESATRAGCPVLSLDGATVGRGLFARTFTVKVAGREVGQVTSTGDGYAYTAGGAAQAAVAISAGADGRTATVTGCDGERIGRIVEIDGPDASSYRIQDASGKTVAESGTVDGTTWSMVGAGVSASIKNDHWILDRYALTVSGMDGRLVLAAALMNNDALYRRAAQRRHDNPHEPHGGRGDR